MQRGTLEIERPDEKQEKEDNSAPLRVVWSQFVRHCRESPMGIWEWPDVYLCQEWFIFQQYARAGESY